MLQEARQKEVIRSKSVPPASKEKSKSERNLSKRSQRNASNLKDGAAEKVGLKGKFNAKEENKEEKKEEKKEEEKKEEKKVYYRGQAKKQERDIVLRNTS